ncbi:unnamed protein product [marine sediment metagenome]|uniref:Uncharacterized protein n=1 Tax=marine sediment metagenome TaxID=412755 RepID=X0TD54_9ZZZZ
MDTGRGNFVPINAEKEKELLEKISELQNEYPSHGGVFHVGETVELKGSKFKIQKIIPKKLILRLLSKMPKEQDEEFHKI